MVVIQKSVVSKIQLENPFCEIPFWASWLSYCDHFTFTRSDLDDHDDPDDHGRFIGGRKKSGSVGQRAGRPPASAASSTNV